jgi:hypothetical protein
LPLSRLETCRDNGTGNYAVSIIGKSKFRFFLSDMIMQNGIEDVLWETMKEAKRMRDAKDI